MIKNSYASEIKKPAIKLMQKHFPDTIQLGDIANWKQWNIDWKSIDVIGSGSPCQNLSVAGNKEGINGEKSRLFYVFIEILKHVEQVNPNVLFLQENVASAPAKDVGIMTRELQIIPQLIDSALFTAQRRKRLYWTNIKVTPTLIYPRTNIPLPKDKGILLQDILEHGYTTLHKCKTLLESESRIYKNMDKFYIRCAIARNGLGVCVFRENPDKTIIAPKKYHNLYGGLKNIRVLSQVELERLQGFPDGYTSCLTRNQAASLLGDGWTLPVIENIVKYIKER